jgi:adenylate cyclase
MDNVAPTAPPAHTGWSSECVICATALDGLASVPFKLAGISRSSRNPNLCNRCNTHAEEGRVVEITVLFADLSAFTELTHELGPEKTSEVVDAFLQMATYALVRHDAFIDKYVGDAVMAFFNVPIRRADHSVRAVNAAAEILAGIPALNARFGLNLNAVVSIAMGHARVGRLGSSDGKDYTAIGDVVNLAARLEGVAARGEIVLDAAVYEQVAAEHPTAVAETVSLKGFKEPVACYRLPMGAEPAKRSPQSMMSGDEPPASALARLGAMIFGLLGAPCAIGSLIGPMAVVLGFSTLAGTALSNVLEVFDAAPIRIPALVLGTLGSVANIYTVWHARSLRHAIVARGGLATETTQERRRARLVIGLALLSLFFVCFELYAHTNIQGHSWP